MFYFTLQALHNEETGNVAVRLVLQKYDNKTSLIDNKRDNPTILEVSGQEITLQQYSAPAIKMQAWLLLHSFYIKLGEHLRRLQWERILDTTLIPKAALRTSVISRPAWSLWNSASLLAERTSAFTSIYSFPPCCSLHSQTNWGKNTPSWLQYSLVYIHVTIITFWFSALKNLNTSYKFLQTTFPK